MSIKIALVRRSFRLDGGAEHAVVNFVKAYKGLGFEVVLLCESWSNTSELFDHVYEFRCQGWTRFSRLKSFTERVEAWILNNPDYLIQSHEWVRGASILRLGDGLHSEWLRYKLLKGGFLFQLRHRFSRFHYYKLRQESKCLQDDAIKAVIVNSLMVRSSVEKQYCHLAEKIMLVRNECRDQRNLVSLSPRPPVEGQRIVLGFLGSGWARKGLKTIIEALPFVGTNVELIVSGTDKSERQYQKLAEKLRVQDRICWKGIVTDLPRFYRSIDCLALPSDYDPFPNVVTEAMVAGVPVIASSRTGAVDYAHLNGVLICEPSDRKSFKQQVDKLAGLTLEDLFDLRLASAQFTQEEVSGQIFQVIQEIIDENITH